jgi:ATP10 protein
MMFFLSRRTHLDEVTKRHRHGLPRLATGLTLVVFLLATLPPATAQSLPKTDEVTLAGDQINLENSLKGNAGVLILGFSKKSEGQVREWTKALLSEFSAERSVVIFEMPILESMPRFVRGMAVRSMKSASSPTERQHFLPVFHNEMQWKQVAQFSEPDDAYVVVLDKERKIVWREHGPMDEKRKTELIARVRTLLSATHSEEPATGQSAHSEL